MSLSEHRYTARIAPCSSTASDAIRCGATIIEDGQRFRESFASGCLTWPIESVAVLLDHDETQRVGFVTYVRERDGWYEATFVLNMDKPLAAATEESLRLGTPVSIGAKSLATDEELANLGTAIPIKRHTKAILEEVTIVAPGLVAAYAGAKVTEIVERESPSMRRFRERQERERAEAKPATVKAKPAPIRTSATATMTRSTRDREEWAELERRMDRIERLTGKPANMEHVIAGLQRDHGPSLDELHAQVQRDKTRAA